MTKEFFEIVLAKLINQRDMIEMDIEDIFNQNISTDDKTDAFISLLDLLTNTNENIETLTGMLPEGVLVDEPHMEDNNNK